MSPTVEIVPRRLGRGRDGTPSSSAPTPSSSPTARSRPAGSSTSIQGLGRWVIASGIGAFAEAIEDGVSGRLVAARRRRAAGAGAGRMRASGGPRPSAPRPGHRLGGDRARDARDLRGGLPRVGAPAKDRGDLLDPQPRAAPEPSSARSTCVGSSSPSSAAGPPSWPRPLLPVLAIWTAQRLPAAELPGDRAGPARAGPSSARQDRRRDEGSGAAGLRHDLERDRHHLLHAGAPGRSPAARHARRRQPPRRVGWRWWGRAFPGAPVQDFLQSLGLLPAGSSAAPLNPQTQRLQAAARVTDALRSGLKVTRNLNALVIDIDVAASDPVSAAAIANAVVEEYLIRQGRVKRQVADQALAWMNGEIEDLGGAGSAT